jgi:hypothetical protein
MNIWAVKRFQRKKMNKKDLDLIESYNFDLGHLSIRDLDHLSIQGYNFEYCSP